MLSLLCPDADITAKLPNATADSGEEGPPRWALYSTEQVDSFYRRVSGDFEVI